MLTETIELTAFAPGTRHSLQVQRFGTPGARPKVYIQGALHADEVPAIVVTQALSRHLKTLEAQGAILGEVVLVPYANPIGLAQHTLGHHQGRFDLRDGGNFNRGYAELAAKVVEPLRPQLTQDVARNTVLVRQALVHAVDQLTAANTTQELKNTLLRLAIDADIVLDLHCDTDAVLHLYAMTPQSADAEALGAALGVQALLLAIEAGDSPFDEACARPWYQLQQWLPQFPIPMACFGATVELRGETDTSHALAAQDVQGLCAYLAMRGVLALPQPTGSAPAPWPVALCEPTPLAGSEPITAPHAGVVIFHRQPGQRVKAGDLIADLLNADTGELTPLHCQSDGLLYARCGQRWASAGKRLAKIAGTSLARTGKLLSP
ncbi:succinylglutamate desuccinylase/aspartoacylase family protein [Rhodoferax aquaticus]|uniref:Succinylglutamate desuccinylase/aspartoacylase family protein n=1 Tax=Rhodoferax aquaticus TaxID=2527691 RepID=A0A515EKN5_9BURK|nr:succinylglutamate desuccinylase/aspartoacylase family protein [Rhodoferax aquaticus]QDL53169.1 succinylglutamate desuccinylase/aspartoacylase family protein [Rhodoferax aquaticus]